jgi:hypothetical protein
MDLTTLRGVAMFLVALTPPAVAVFRHPGRGMRLTERFLLALALAPMALGAPALVLALALHLPPEWCLWQSEFLWIVAALWPRSAPRAKTPAMATDLSTAPAPGSADPDPLPERGHGFPSIAALTSAALAALLVASVSLPVPMVRMWSDAWFHAAATIEVTRHGVPPQDPNFAGIPLYYPWVFHFLIALIGAATRLSPFHNMALLNAWAAAVTVLAAAQLTYRAFGRAAAQWAGAIAVLGLDPFGWLLWLIRGMVGETTGLLTMIGGLATTNGAAMSLAVLFPPSHSSLLNRFWTGTALTPAIALGVASAWSAARALDRPSRGAWLRTLVLALSMFALHPAYAAFATGAILIGLIVVARRAAERGTALLLISACALAAAAGVAWVRECSVPGVTTGMRPGLYLRNLWSLLIAVGPWWVVAAPALARSRGGAAAARYAAAAALAAVAMALFLVLPEYNSDKLFYLAWVSLVPLIAAGYVIWADRLRLPAIARVAVLAALVLPTAGLYAIGTASDRRSPGVLVRGETAATRSQPLATGPEAAGYKFMRAQLPRDAVVIESIRPTVNEPVPVLGERRVFCGSLNVYLANHFGDDRIPHRELLALMDEFAVRRSIQQSLFHDATLNPAQSIYLEGFSQPLYLLVRRREVGDPIWEGFRGRPEWNELIANEEIRLYRYEPRGVAPFVVPPEAPREAPLLAPRLAP